MISRLFPFYSSSQIAHFSDLQLALSIKILQIGLRSSSLCEIIRNHSKLRLLDFIIALRAALHDGARRLLDGHND